jgi:hypothetical protein
MHQHLGHAWHLLHCLLLTFISNVLTSSVALHVSVSALQQAIHCLEMRRSGNVLLEYDAVKACSCWQGDSRCPTCARHQSLVDELDAIEAQLADLDADDSAFESDEESDSIPNSSEDSGEQDDSSSEEDDSSSTGGDLGSHQGSRTSSCSSKPGLPMLSLAAVLPEHCEMWDADEEDWNAQ